MEQNRTKIAKERMLKALESSLGIVTTALKIADLSRTNYYRWLDEDEEFLKKTKEVENIEKDFIRSKYYECIKDKVPSVVIHAAKTQLGLSDKQQVDITSNDEAIKIHIDLGDKS
tara:strand:- start:239 stop:583 length:345 start_codon:yes stop_codon:yes gene_type:complete